MTASIWEDPVYVNLLRTNWARPASEAALSVIARLARTYDYPGFNEVGLKVLDVGCGTGRLAKLFHRAEYFGMDSSREMVSACKDKGLNVIPASVYAIPWEDKFFDLVICHAVLMHIGDVPAALASLWRVTKRRLIVSFYWKWSPFHKGVVPVWAEDRFHGCGWWQPSNVLPRWMIKRLVRKFTNRHSFHWHKGIEHTTDCIVFAVMDR